MLFSKSEGTYTKTLQLKAESRRRSDYSLDGESERQLHDSKLLDGKGIRLRISLIYANLQPFEAETRARRTVGVIRWTSLVSLQPSLLPQKIRRKELD